MQRKFSRIAGLGEGKRLKKSVDLALRHPRTEVVAIEKAEASQLDHFKYLRELGAKTKPNNLTIKSGIAAEKYLAGERPNSFNHLYAHFLTQHLAYSTRQQLFKQAWRTLKPGAKFMVIEFGAHKKTLEIELRNTGFGVSARRITSEELLKLDTDNAYNNAMSSLELKNMVDTLKTLSPIQRTALLARITKGKATTIEELKKLNLEEVRELHTALFTKYNGPNPPQEAKNSHKLVLQSLKGDLLYEKPFVVITARKPRVRYL
ncbi:MAG: hypothetical protein WCW13_02475 [archaeon]|jgi:hypothetical protein